MSRNNNNRNKAKGQGGNRGNNAGRGAGQGGQGQGNKAKRRRRKPKQQRHFWVGQDPMDPTDEVVIVAADPAAVVRSLGPPPLSSHSQVAEHYFSAVYDRAVGLASALGMAGDLLDDEAD